MKTALLTAIDAAAVSLQRPDGSAYRALTHGQTLAIARRTGASVRAVELAALKNGTIPQRYARNSGALIPAQQAALLGSHAAVVGLGGLGGAVVEILARLGVGALTLIDGDMFEESNLNRQLLCTGANLGTAKATAAGRRLAQVNPAVAMRVVNARLTAENADDLLSGTQVAVDCLDNLPDRFVLEAGARRVRIPLVSAAVGGACGQLTVVYPEDDPGLTAIYGAPENAPPQGIEARLGTLPYTAVTLASLACSEVLKVLLATGNGLRRQLLIVDLMDNRFETMQL